MNTVEDFTRRIDELLAAGGIGVVHRAIDVGHSGMTNDASLLEVPRLIVGLEGSAVFAKNLEEGSSEVTLRPGDALFVAPGRWVRAQPRGPYVSMGMVFYPRSTRVYLMRGGRTRDGKPGKPTETWIVPEGAGEEIRGLLAAIGGRVPSSGAARYGCACAESLLLAVREMLVRPRDSMPAGKARYTWQAACDFVQENLHRPLNRKDIARHLGVHPNHLSRLFAEFGSESFSEFLQSRRLERARLLMTDPRLNIAEVARLSGFSSGNYFTRVFRSKSGRTPTHARRSVSGD